MFGYFLKVAFTDAAVAQRSVATAWQRLQQRAASPHV